MYILMIVVFALGYLAIALEHPLKIDKAASALLTGVLCWVLLVFGRETIFSPAVDTEFIDAAVLYHVGEIGEILFFLLGAMTIVELIDAHDGFEVVTARIRTRDQTRLIWILCIATFFFSAVLDNLTTSIVMSTLLKKIIAREEKLWLFAGMIIIAANAGGAWSPIGDVTTIMLWIGGQITALHIITTLFIPSLACLLVPLLFVTFLLRGEVKAPKLELEPDSDQPAATRAQQKIILVLGILGLLFVPVFKNVTHLPPFMGMLLSLGGLWVVAEVLHREDERERAALSIVGVIRRIDTPSILFFLGILLAVASLQTAGHLSELAQGLDETFGNIYIVNTLIGLLSAVVDNVPMVAAAMGMYPLTTYPQDHIFWDLLTYCAGTGGSVLIIGSAAGVATMGILKVDFLWYLKRISWLALLGYFSGLGTYLVLNA